MDLREVSALDRQQGDPEEAISLDDMLDDITLYWFTNTAASSARLYYESFRKDFVRMPLELPIAVSIFKGDMFTPPKVWGERTYSKLFYRTRSPEAVISLRSSSLSCSLANCVRRFVRCGET